MRIKTCVNSTSADAPGHAFISTGTTSKDEASGAEDHVSRLCLFLFGVRHTSFEGAESSKNMSFIGSTIALCVGELSVGEPGSFYLGLSSSITLQRANGLVLLPLPLAM